MVADRSGDPPAPDGRISDALDWLPQWHRALGTDGWVAVSRFPGFPSMEQWEEPLRVSRTCDFPLYSEGKALVFTLQNWSLAPKSRHPTMLIVCPVINPAKI